MNRVLHFFLVLISLSGFSQTVNFGDQTLLFLGEETIFFFGGDASINGSLNNSGTLTSFSDLDLVSNEDVGSLKFTGDSDQTLTGGDLNVVNFEVDKQNRLILMTNQIIVSGALSTINGVIETQKEDDIIVTGNSQDTGAGYVEGKMFGISTAGDPVTFPMGVDGSPNYMTIANLPPGTRVNVECIVSERNDFPSDIDIIGISDKVEWIVKVDGDSVDARITVNYSGVDLNEFFNEFNADIKKAGLVVFSKADTLYHPINGEATGNSAEILNTGIFTSSEVIKLTSEGRVLAMALIPEKDDPEIFVPDAFSISSMVEENRVFRVFFAGALVTEISIGLYDSFNKEVFSANDSGDDLDLSQYSWDGILNSGLEAPEGVYYYRVQLTTNEGQVFNEVGSVFLVK